MSQTIYGLIKYGIFYLLVLLLGGLALHVMFGPLGSTYTTELLVTSAFMTLTYQIQEKNGE